jgi:hypothetical protein
MRQRHQPAPATEGVVVVLDGRKATIAAAFAAAYHLLDRAFVRLRRAPGGRICVRLRPRPRSADAPHARAPLAGAPHARAPLADAPLADAPLAGAPHARVPLADASLVGAPLADAPLARAPLVGAPLARAPLVGAPLADAPLARAFLAEVEEQRRWLALGRSNTRQLEEIVGRALFADTPAAVAPAERPR